MCSKECFKGLAACHGHCRLHTAPCCATHHLQGQEHKVVATASTVQAVLALLGAPCCSALGRRSLCPGAHPPQCSRLSARPERSPPWMQGQSLPDEVCELAEVMESYGLPTLGYAPRAVSEERASQKVRFACTCLHKAQRASTGLSLCGPVCIRLSACVYHTLRAVCHCAPSADFHQGVPISADSCCVPAGPGVAHLYPSKRAVLGTNWFRLLRACASRPSRCSHGSKALPWVQGTGRRHPGGRLSPQLNARSASHPNCSCRLVLCACA